MPVHFCPRTVGQSVYLPWNLPPSFIYTAFFVYSYTENVFFQILVYRTGQHKWIRRENADLLIRTAGDAIKGSRDDRRVSDAEAAEIGDPEALSKFVEGERRSQEQQRAAHKRTRGIELG